MTNQNGQNVPILGGGKPRSGVAFNALARKLDEGGTFEPAQVVMGPGGQPVGIPHRSDYVDAEELVEMIRAVVREEIAASLKPGA